jgi:hypothetical protein
MLEPIKYRQPLTFAVEFNFLKYLRWMLMRKDQPIAHYLVFGNEIEADEEIRRLEDRLKTSFSSSPLDKVVHDYRGQIVKVLDKWQPEEGSPTLLGDILGMPFASAIPKAQSSSISAGIGEWFEDVPEVNVNMGATVLKDLIVESV